MRSLGRVNVKMLALLVGPYVCHGLSGALGKVDHVYMKKIVSIYCSSHIALYFELTTMALNSLDHIKKKNNYGLTMAQIRE